jgi:hypothetical protein
MGISIWVRRMKGNDETHHLHLASIRSGLWAVDVSALDGDLDSLGRPSSAQPGVMARAYIQPAENRGFLLVA